MDQQSYYEYDIYSAGTWWKKDVPVAEPWFQAELNLLAGYSEPHWQPKLRLVWAANILHDITEKPQLKYQRVCEIVTGYDYIKTDGDSGFVKSMNLARDVKLPWEYVPRKETIALGRLRWAIEIHVPAHELKALGRFTNLYSPDGEKILRDLPSEGVYDHYFWIQTAARKYRDPDREVLTAIQAMYLYNLHTSEAQKTLDDIERAKTQTLIGATEAKEIWNSL